MNKSLSDYLTAWKFMMKTAQLSDMSSYAKANMAHLVPATTGDELETPGYHNNL